MTAGVRRGLALAVVAAVAILVLRCGEGDGGGAERQFLSLGTAPTGGAFFPVGGALAEVLAQHGPAGWMVNAEATKGSQENIRRLDAGELDLALSNASITYFAVRGEGWDKAYAMRSIMTLAPNVGLFLAPAGGEVQRIADLGGRRVVLGPSGAGFEFFLRPLLEAHGVRYEDVTGLNATQSSAVDLLADGSAAAAFLGGAIPTASVTQAAASQDVLFVPFDPAAVETLVRDYPFFDHAIIPAGTYRGLDTDFPGLDVGSMHLITSADQDEELVYQVTKTLWENRERVAERHAAGRAINERNVVRDTGTPFHPGAIRFWREIGIWAEKGGEADAPAGAPGATS